MGLIDDIRQRGAEGRLTEEVLYAEVLREMEAGIRRDGLWAKALSEAGGEEAASKARYIKLRVQALRDEVAIALSERKKQRVGVVAQDGENLRGAIGEDDGSSAWDEGIAIAITVIAICMGALLLMAALGFLRFPN